MIALPSIIRVGCFDFMVEDWEPHFANASDRFGECDKMNNIIRIRTDMPRQRIAEVLLHEVLHAIWEVGCCDEGDEEKVVGIIAKMQCQVWRDNPDFVTFISQMLDDGSVSATAARPQPSPPGKRG